MGEGVIDRELLGKRLRSMGILTEWKAFAAMVVEYLDMPAEVIPLYEASERWSRKAERILAFIIEKGNFGHNSDESYYERHSYVVRKSISLWRHTWDGIRYFFIFPMDSIRVWTRIMMRGVIEVVKL